MATATASASDDVPVPDSDEERPPGFSPAASRNEADFESFLRFMRNRRPPGRGRRDDSDDDGRSDDRTNAGPPPSWDGASGFKDYLIRARLWLATTKTKAKARGPLLLKNLTGVPFDSMKYLAKDDSWLRSDDNAEQMLKLMDTKELFGDKTTAKTCCRPLSRSLMVSGVAKAKSTKPFSQSGTMLSASWMSMR